MSKGKAGRGPDHPEDSPARRYARAAYANLNSNICIVQAEGHCPGGIATYCDLCLENALVRAWLAGHEWRG